jgi:hypothetical protein
MHDLKKKLFRVIVTFAVLSFLITPAQPGFAEEASSSSKVTFHVA